MTLTHYPPALALVALAAVSAHADMNSGPECVRMWTRALDPSYPPALDPPLGDGGGPMYRKTLESIRGLTPLDLLIKDPVGYIARTCHMDRA